MRLLIVTPLHSDSAIGRMNAAVGECLTALGHQVGFLRSEWDLAPNTSRHVVRGPVYYWRDVDLEEIRRKFDVAIVHLGDNYAFHAGAFAALDSMACLGVFHDFYAYNLFNGWLADNGFDEGRREGEILATYGPSGLAALNDLRQGRLDLAGVAAEIPMTEWLARRCAGAVAHAEFYKSRLRLACVGPVDQIRLCAPDRPFGHRKPKPKDGRLTIVTVGVMNANKCADRVIEAIGRVEGLKDHVSYRLVGSISDEERTRLVAVANKVGFTGLNIEGAASEEDFTAALADADIICCLRKPVLEGASGSVIDGLLAGRPVIVANTGFYGELPDDVVRKIAPQIEVEDLSAALIELASDHDRRQTLGRKAREFAEHAFAPQRYAQDLLQISEKTVEFSAPFFVNSKFTRGMRALNIPKANAISINIEKKIANFLAPATDGFQPSRERHLTQGGR